LGSLFAGGDPVGFGCLVAAAQGQGICGDILGDAGCGGDVGSFAYGEGGYEGGVGAYEDVVVDLGGMFAGAVVVAGDGAGTYVYAVSDGCVAEVGEMVGLGAFADPGVFGLYEVADVGLFADLAAGAEVGVGA
jgi:hypothetical protein